MVHHYSAAPDSDGYSSFSFGAALSNYTFFLSPCIVPVSIFMKMLFFTTMASHSIAVNRSLPFSSLPQKQSALTVDFFASLLSSFLFFFSSDSACIIQLFGFCSALFFYPSREVPHPRCWTVSAMLLGPLSYRSSSLFKRAPSHLSGDPFLVLSPATQVFCPHSP